MFHLAHGGLTCFAFALHARPQYISFLEKKKEKKVVVVVVVVAVAVAAVVLVVLPLLAVAVVVVVGCREWRAAADSKEGVKPARKK